jgi:hypothetical protein
MTKLSLTHTNRTGGATRGDAVVVRATALVS